LEYLI